MKSSGKDDGRETFYMRYEICYDVLFMEVALWNACSLLLANEWLGKAVKTWRILLGVIPWSMAFVLTIFLPITWPFKLGSEIAFAMLGLGFSMKVKGFSCFFRVLENYLICGALWGSGLLLMERIVFCQWKGDGKAFLIMATEPVLLPVFLRLIRNKRNESGKVGKAVLISGSNVLCVKAFVDTGNSLYEPVSGEPVCVLDAGSAGELWKEEDLWRAIPWHGVDGAAGMLKGYRLTELRINLGGPVKVLKGVYVAVSEKDNARGEEGCLIIQPKLMER